MFFRKGRGLAGPFAVQAKRSLGGGDGSDANLFSSSIGELINGLSIAAAATSLRASAPYRQWPRGFAQLLSNLPSERISELSQAIELARLLTRIGSNFALQQFYVAYLQGHRFSHYCEQPLRLRRVKALVLQVRHSGLLHSEPAFARGHKLPGPRQQFPDDQLGMGANGSQKMS
jgi:hypothetical protein